MDKACEICGSNSNPDLIANCTWCKNTYEHWYCMPKRPDHFPAAWCCDDCQKKANARKKHALAERNCTEGQKTQIQGPCHAKVKFISSGEVAVPVKPFGRKCFAMRCRDNQFSLANSSTEKEPSATKRISPFMKESFDAQSLRSAEELKMKVKARPGTVIGCESEICNGSLQKMNNPVTLFINPSEQPAKRAGPLMCWMGSICVFNGADQHLGEFTAYSPSKALYKVREMTKKMPKNLKLEMLPRMDDWPKKFQTDGPIDEDIGLYFFSNELEWHQNRRSRLLEHSCSFVMRTYIDGIKLLVYSSEVFPADYQRMVGETYLWGVFVRAKKCKCRPGLSPSTPACSHEGQQSSWFAHKSPPGFTRRFTN